MEPLAKLTNQIQATAEDIGELLRTNPLAAQQLTAITWHRIALELEARLAEQSEES
jgi:hypothetical protein